MTSLFIDGKWRAGQGDVLTSTDPANGDTVWQGATATADDVNAAFAAARSAFTEWARKPFEARVGLLRRYVEVLDSMADQIPPMISRETGKVLWETTAELGAMKGKVDLSIQTYEERTGQKTLDAAFGRAELVHRPHGVMAVMGPFNFPGHLPNGHIIPALLAGNTIVFKPSELAPGMGELLVRALAEAGIPDGVVNLVQGGRETGAALLSGDLDGVLFTGSAATGTFIHKTFGGRPDIMLALEMGGNNPLIAWDFGDVDAAADIAAQSAYLTSGQRCTCARRLFVPTGTAGDALIEAIIARAEGLKVGKWDDDDVFMGSLVNEQAADGALAFQDTLIAKGGKPMKRLERLDISDAFVSPGVIDMTLATEPHDEELFGPFLQVYRVDRFDDAIAKANDTRFGLSGGLISQDEGLWAKAHISMRAGILNFNRPTAGASSSLPFGGPGLSGNHRPSAAYAADYCAWPQASQIAPQPERLAAQGFPK